MFNSLPKVSAISNLSKLINEINKLLLNFTYLLTTQHMGSKSQKILN